MPAGLGGHQKLSMFDLTRWYQKGSGTHSAFSLHLRMMDLFLERRGHHHIHACKMLDDRAALRMECEILFVLGDIEDDKEIDTKDLFVLLDDTVASARQRGFQKLREQQP